MDMLRRSLAALVNSPSPDFFTFVLDTVMHEVSESEAPSENPADQPLETSRF
jgi:hypothetical protein